MRTVLRLAVLVLVSSACATSFAREVDDRGNTCLSSVPVHATSSSMRVHRGKKEATAPAKYDVVYPVRDFARVATRDHGAI